MKLFDWFFPDEPDETPEQIRGVADAKLPALSNEQLLCVALARLMEGNSIQDDVLIKELYERGKYRPIMDSGGSVVAKVYE